MEGRLLVWLPTWLGDVVLATPALQALREGLEGWRIGLVGPPAVRDLLGGAPGFDAFETYDKRGDDRGAAGAWRLARRLRAGRWEAVLLLPNSLRSALVSRAAGIPRRVGYARQGRGFLLTDPVPPGAAGWSSSPVPMAPHYLALLPAFGLAPDPRKPSLPLSREEDEETTRWFRDQGLREGEILIGLAPGASFGASKLWPVEHWGWLGRALQAKGSRVLVLHGPGERSLAVSIEESVGGGVLRSTRRRPTLSFLKAAVRRLALLVSTDAGPRHVATAFDRPAIVLMGPNDPRLTTCFLDRTEILRVEVDCGPCRKPRCVTDHRCMTGIAPARVLEACHRWLARVPPVPALALPLAEDTPGEDRGSVPE